MLLFVLAGLPLAGHAQESRLPLPVQGPPGAQAFEAGGPTAAVLTGLLVPSAGPLTSWAPVFRTLGADGRLTGEQSGAWNGPLPSRWVRLSKADSVVAGMRVLVRIGPGAIQTRQLQVFWRLWRDGAVQGAIAESPVYGQAAAGHDIVRIVELTVPDGAVAVGLYGEVLGGAVVQTSLLVRTLTPPPAQEVPEARPLMGPKAPEAPEAPRLAPLPNAD